MGKDARKTEETIAALVAEFHRLPREWQPEAVRQVQYFARQDEPQPRFVGEEQTEEP
jgi:hypothetical protein